MCDYSLEHLTTRDAVAGDKLIATRFSSGTIGFSSVDGYSNTPVCLRPGTELVFENIQTRSGFFGFFKKFENKTAKFEKLPGSINTHRDAVVFDDGTLIILHNLRQGQKATVIQLPVASSKVTASEPVTEPAE
jgi:hypothetical protein